MLLLTRNRVVPGIVLTTLTVFRSVYILLHNFNGKCYNFSEYFKKKSVRTNNNAGFSSVLKSIMINIFTTN